MTKTYPKVLVSDVSFCEKKKSGKNAFFSVSWGYCPLKTLNDTNFHGIIISWHYKSFEPYFM